MLSESVDKASVGRLGCEEHLPTVAAAFKSDVRRCARRLGAQRVQAVQGVVPLVSAPSLLCLMPRLLSLGVPAVAETAVPDGFRTGRFLQGLRKGDLGGWGGVKQCQL